MSTFDCRQGRRRARCDYHETGELNNPFEKETELYKGYQLEAHEIYLEELKGDPYREE